MKTSFLAVILNAKVCYYLFSQESRASHAVGKDLDDDHPMDQDSPTTASELDDVGQLTTNHPESTPETLQSEQVLEGKASKISLAPNSKFLQKKLKVINSPL